MARKQHETQKEKEPVKVNSQPLQQKNADAHRHCPVCHGRLGGIGKSYATRGMKTYYKCGTCGHNWSATFKVHQTIIEHREVDVPSER